MPIRLIPAALLLLVALTATAPAADPWPLVFEDDFARGADRWEPTDPAAYGQAAYGQPAYGQPAYAGAAPAYLAARPRTLAPSACARRGLPAARRGLP